MPELLPALARDGGLEGGVVHRFRRAPDAGSTGGRQLVAHRSQEVPCPPFPPTCTVRIRPARGEPPARRGLAPGRRPVRSARPAAARPVRPRGGRSGAAPWPRGYRAPWSAPGGRRGPAAACRTPASGAAALVVAVVQALLAQRPIAQLNRWLADDVLCAVSVQQRRRRTDPAGAAVRSGRGCGRSGSSIPTLRWRRWRPDLLVGTGHTAVALRLEALGDRWLCTALELDPAGPSLGCDLHSKPRPESGDWSTNRVRSASESNR